MSSIATSSSSSSSSSPPPSVPWVEKYRPESMDDLLGHEDITRTSKQNNILNQKIDHFQINNKFTSLITNLSFSFSLLILLSFFFIQQINTTKVQRLINKNRLPHLLFYGPPGTGKTSTVMAIAQQLYGGSLQSMVLSLNASDDRGINVVRDQIKTFAGTRKLFSSGMKLVILDEADHMTNDAQFALRRVIEKYSSNARFCIICNYVSKIIPALQSRCTKFRFSPLDHANMLVQAKRTVEAEGLKIDEGK